MTYKADRILKHLYQGGMPPPGRGLKDAGVDVLVLAAAEHQDAAAYDDVLVICAPGDDDKRRYRLDRFIDGWRDAAAQVADHVRAGRNVLVTCMSGWNRSGLINALAVRELTGWSGKRIVAHIKSNRQYALNNETFVNYICECFPDER